MYIAQLFIGDCLYKTIELDRFRDYVVIYTHQPLHLSRAFDDISPDTMIEQNIMVFRVNLDARREQYVIPYSFETATGNLRLSEFEVYEVLPTSLNEPNENVNLNKLKDKLRDSLKIKELLIRYYNS